MLKVVERAGRAIRDHAAPFQTIEAVRAGRSEYRYAPGMAGTKKVYRLIEWKLVEFPAYPLDRGGALHKPWTEFTLRDRDEYGFQLFSHLAHNLRQVPKVEATGAVTWRVDDGND